MHRAIVIFCALFLRLSQPWFYPYPIEDGCRGTKTGDSEDEKVEANEQRQDEPVDTVDPGQDAAYEYKDAGHQKNDSFQIP
jgi:hypothetical protein